MFWVNFLHIYQPPTQKPYWIKRIGNECYRKLVAGFKKNPKAKATININGCLTELLVKHGFQDVIDDLKFLGNRGQIEFTQSAKYHPFLPLIPEKEIIRQIELNHETNKKYFGKAFDPKGFFPPEMGYSDKVAKIVAKLGYEWIILDELAHSGQLEKIKENLIYQWSQNKNLDVYFRNRKISFHFLSAQAFSSLVVAKIFDDRLQKDDNYLLTAMDGETFGHHRPGLENLLFDLYKLPNMKSINLSEIPNHFSNTEPIEPIRSSWALMKRDIENKTPFSRWSNPENQIQKWQWELTDIAIELVGSLDVRIKNYQKIRKSLDRSLHSDQYWWSSAQPWWSLEMIEAGASELLETINLIPKLDKKTLDKANQLYQKIIATGFIWQKTGKVEQMAKEADEDITQRITKELQYIPKKEFDKIIKGLNEQMLNAVERQEYERATQIRDRVKELKEKEKEITKSKKYSPKTK